MSDSAMHDTQGNESELIDRLADEFEAAWKASAPLDIASCISRAPVGLRGRLADELVRLDIEYRVQRGQPRSVEQYAAEIIELDRGAEAIADLRAYAGEIHRKYAMQNRDGPVVPLAAAAIPANVGKFRIIREIHLSGGQADVYLGEHPVSNALAAIKLWRVAGGDDAGVRAQFLKEGVILTEVSHRHIARVYDMDFHEGRPFLAMEYIRGRSLHQMAAQTTSWRQAALLVSQVAAALHVVHMRGVLHLDVTPRNVMVDETGAVKLIDFGLARFRGIWKQDAHDGVSQGTPAYLSPEQANGESEHFDPRTDVFGMGAVLYALITGNAPYRAATVTEVLQLAMDARIDLKLLRKSPAPWWLKRVCRRAMAKEPGNRYATAGQFAATLRRGLLWRRALFATTAVLVLLCVGLAIWKPWVGRAPAVVMPFPDPTLVIYRLGDDGRVHGIPAGLTMTDQDQFYVKSHIPPGLYAALVVFDPMNPPHLGPQIAPETSVRELRYPPLKDGYEVYTRIKDATAGTALVLVLTSPSGPISLDDVQPVLASGGAWPVLNANSTYGFTTTGVDAIELNRDFEPGQPQRPVNPDEATRLRLEALRLQLMAKYPAFHGLAFRHEPTAAGLTTKRSGS